ncbi:hypothetical protein Pth03_69480 [Planotetraspora thailandica]|uniref:Uncharacterized protein n=1 Tax=Planotetraspora thailandica TaxID=487172 RepID=A0A8J4DDE5_9ACTN|nr:hypothetical protein [Planotetraspora thailandica]GII58559.1 hypothetical protein Pth03_69480 [Planotetraspora thailandica]
MWVACDLLLGVQAGVEQAGDRRALLTARSADSVVVAETLSELAVEEDDRVSGGGPCLVARPHRARSC